MRLTAISAILLRWNSVSTTATLSPRTAVTAATASRRTGARIGWLSQASSLSFTATSFTRTHIGPNGAE